MVIKTLLINCLMIFSICFFAIVMNFLSQARAENKNENTTEKQSVTAVFPVDSKYVCMVNDQLYENEQIPVTVDGKTYYGCCEMCKARLMNDRNSRESRDPVSGKVVDKALSLTGAATDGSVYYFENEENLKKFKENMSRE